MNYQEMLFCQWYNMSVLHGAWLGTPEELRTHIEDMERVLKLSTIELWRYPSGHDVIVGTWHLDGKPQWLTKTRHHIVIVDGKAYEQYYNVASGRRPQVFVDSQGRIPGNEPGLFFYPEPGELDRFDPSMFGSGALVLYHNPNAAKPFDWEWRFRVGERLGLVEPAR